ncbi:aldehyde dehydrogenase family protein [Bdellovibrio sp. SKB1291214]|uniref:aldehyde dehydrogenase family protein n=1 Tax=Bdellovibrio sp. SKB1291214 TaxID=1732569 RepID=UPI000B51BB7F|nr:aldehyde dehydrogenase family protein [Bdellovibrio sp. SKB1291214]UYL10076.1 aldehyde dehydrogenase family protein [Bdellovibrio sp. SKB1291214]
MEILNFISGEYVASGNQKTFAKLSPFDNSELAQVSDSDAMDVIRCLQSSKKALTAFETSTVEQRVDILNKLAQYFEANSAEIAYQEALHQGLPQKFVLKYGVQASISVLRETARNLLMPLPEGRSVKATGLVGIITSWCLSLRLVTERLAPALAARNAVIIKVSEQSPITAKILGDAFKAIELPVGLVQVLNGGAEVAQIIAGHPGIRAITAAGKSSTMEAIAKAALPQMKKLQLSGGAKNAAIVLTDFDFKNRMSEILTPFLLGQGQMCWNTTRLFVLDSFAKEFNEELSNFLKTLKPLTSPEGDSIWTPLISKDRADILNLKIQFGVSEHGKFLAQTEGEISGNFVKPTFMVDLPNCSVMQQDELFAPLFLITSVKYQHESVKWTNTSYLGHSAIIWAPEEKFMKVADKLDVGLVTSNSWMTDVMSPVFGVKQSSFGITEMSWAGSFYSDVKKLTMVP